MAVLLMYNAQDSYTVEQIHEHTQIKMVNYLYLRFHYDYLQIKIISFFFGFLVSFSVFQPLLLKQFNSFFCSIYVLSTSDRELSPVSNISAVNMFLLFIVNLFFIFFLIGLATTSFGYLVENPNTRKYKFIFLMYSI